MARFEQYNLHPGRNRHYQSGRQRDPWHIRERMVMVPVPTNHVDIDVQFDIYDTIEKKHSSYYTYRFASSFKDIDDLMAECDPDSRFLPRSPRLNHCHMSKRGETIRYSCNSLDTNIRQIRTSSSPYGTASYRQLVTNTKIINITRDDSGLPFKQYLVPRYDTDPRFSDGEHDINISQDLTDVTFSEYDQPEGNHYYTIDQSEFKEAMDKPEQVLASVIKALRKEQR